MLVSDPEAVSTTNSFAKFGADHGCEDGALSLRNHVDILVVDDNRLVADTTSAILKRFGFCVITAYDGTTALRMAAEANPDILLSDVMMPVFNGVDLAISVRKILPETAVLLFSGQAATKDILEAARQEGYFFEVLSKPIHPEDLLGHLNRLRQR